MKLGTMEFWSVPLGILAGFFSVTAFFIANSPSEFYYQTVFSQFSYRVGGNIQPFFAQISKLPEGLSSITTFPNDMLSDTISMLCVILAVVWIVLLLIKTRANFTRSNLFLLVTMSTSLALCSLFNPFGAMRYMAPLFIFLPLAIASFIPDIDCKSVSGRLALKSRGEKAMLIITALLIVLFSAGTLAMHRNYSYVEAGNITCEEQSYLEAIAYLKQAGAENVYSMNPVLIALAPELTSNVEFDAYGYLFTSGHSPESLIENQIAAGVDYVVIDTFLTRLISQKAKMQEFMKLLEQNGTLVKVITPSNPELLQIKIYSLQGN
jgi:hypothetical protein